MRIVYYWSLFALVLLLMLTGCASETEKEVNHLENAKEYIAQERYKEASLELKNAIKLNPDNDAAHLELGKVYLKLEEVPMAIQSYDTAVKKNPDNMEAHLKLGQVLLLAKNTMAARKAAKIILEKNPEDFEGMMLLAAVQVQEKNSPEAVKTLQNALAVYPGAVRVGLFLADIYVNMGETDQAENIYLDLIFANPSAVLPYIKCIKFYLTTGKKEKADKVSDQLLANAEEYHSELLNIASFCERKKMFHVAEKIYRYAASNAPPDATKPSIRQSAFYAGRGNVEKAMAIMQNALDVYPDHADILTQMAYLHMGTGDMKAADAAVIKALDQEPEHESANYLKGVIDFRQKRIVDAMHRFDDIIKNNPNMAMAYYYKALCLLKNGPQNDPDANLFRAAAGYQDDADTWFIQLAEKNMLKAVELKPGFLPAKIILAEIYLRNRSIKNATSQIEEILAISPDNEKALSLQAGLNMLIGDLKGAEKVCQKVLMKQKDNSTWLARLGVVYAAMKRFEDAESACRKALDINPIQFDALQLLVDLSLQANDPEKAFAVCKTHKQRLKDNPPATAIVDNMIGHIFLTQNDPKTARRYFRQSVTAEPRFILPKMALANLNIADDQIEDAVKELEEVLAINTDYLPAHMALGDLYYRRGDKRQSEKYYRSALKIESDYGPAANNLAYVLSAYGGQRLQEALKLAQIAVGAMPDNATAWDTLGWIHYKTGSYFQAQMDLKKSLSINPEDATVNYHMGLASYKNDEFDQARKYLRKALEIDPDFEEAAEARALLDK